MGSSRSSSTVTEMEVYGHGSASEVEGEEGAREGGEEECLDDDPVIKIDSEEDGEPMGLEESADGPSGWETDMSADHAEKQGQEPNPPHVPQSVDPDQVETLPMESETLEYVVDSQWKLERMREEDALQKAEAEASGVKETTPGKDAVGEEIESDDDDKKTCTKDYSNLSLTFSNLDFKILSRYQVDVFLRFLVQESIGFPICQDLKPLAPLPPMQAELEKQVDALCETLVNEPGTTNEDLMKAHTHTTHD